MVFICTASDPTLDSELTDIEFFTSNSPSLRCPVISFFFLTSPAPPWGSSSLLRSLSFISAFLRCCAFTSFRHPVGHECLAQGSLNHPRPPPTTPSTTYSSPPSVPHLSRAGRWTLSPLSLALWPPRSVCRGCLGASFYTAAVT